MVSLPCTSELSYTQDIGPETGFGPTEVAAKKNAFKLLGDFTKGRMAAMEKAKDKFKCDGTDCTVDANALSITEKKVDSNKIGNDFVYTAKYEVKMKVSCRKKPALVLASFTNFRTDLSNFTNIKITEVGALAQFANELSEMNITNVAELLADMSTQSVDTKILSTDVLDSTNTLAREVKLLQGKVDTLTDNISNT